MKDVPRDRGVERPARDGPEERPALESGPVAEPNASSPGSADHLLGQVDARHPMPGFQQGEANQSGPGAGVKDERVGGKIGRPDQAFQRRRVGLDRGLLEPGGLTVEGRREIAIVLGGLGIRHQLGSSFPGSGQFSDRLGARIHQPDRTPIGAGEFGVEAQAEGFVDGGRDLAGRDWPIPRGKAGRIR